MEISQAVSVLRAELDTVDGFLMSLRLGKGADKGKYAILTDALETIERSWKEMDVVPKGIVALIFSLDSAMESCSYSYPPDEAEAIRALAAQVTERLGRIFARTDT